MTKTADTLTGNDDLSHFIAYAPNSYEIYGIGETDQEALSDAVEGFHRASVAEDEINSSVQDLITVRCTRALAVQVEQQGGGVSWTLRDAGFADLA
jgi:hypothetical protein